MIENACYDIPDERDYLYKDVFQKEFLWAENFISKSILDNVEYQNQWLEEITKMMCVFYSTWHGSNEENFQEWSKTRIINKDLWLEAEKLWRLDITKWASVSDWPRTAKDLGYITGWTLIETIEEAKHSIINKRPIVVWSNKINWVLWRKYPFVLWGTSWSGHAILIIWYDDDYEEGCFIIKQSYWKDKYYNWKQYLKYSDFWLLYTWKYSLIDSIDPILSYKQTIMDWINLEMAKVGFELWLYNWKDNEKPITREECITVVVRWLEKILKWELTLEKFNEVVSKYKG